MCNKTINRRCNGTKLKDMNNLVSKIKSTSPVTESLTSSFKDAKFAHNEQLAYEFLETVLGEGFYPEDAQMEWTDFAYLDGEIYAVFGTESVMCQSAPATYVKVESEIFDSFIQECKKEEEREEEEAEWRKNNEEERYY